jgi:hypothetical protein
MSLQSQDRTSVDTSRSIKPSSNFKGASGRRLDVSIGHTASPSARGGVPLILYSHGT